MIKTSEILHLLDITPWRLRPHKTLSGPTCLLVGETAWTKSELAKEVLLYLELLGVDSRMIAQSTLESYLQTHQPKNIIYLLAPNANPYDAAVIPSYVGPSLADCVKNPSSKKQLWKLLCTFGG